jgi:hypothetical protein
LPRQLTLRGSRLHYPRVAVCSFALCVQAYVPSQQYFRYLRKTQLDMRMNPPAYIFLTGDSCVSQQRKGQSNINALLKTFEPSAGVTHLAAISEWVLWQSFSKCQLKKRETEKNRVRESDISLRWHNPYPQRTRMICCLIPFPSTEEAPSTPSC